MKTRLDVLKQHAETTKVLKFQGWMRELIAMLERCELSYKCEVDSLTDALKDLEYRHETLKILYADGMNFDDDDVPVDLAIDEFILEEQSHS